MQIKTAIQKATAKGYRYMGGKLKWDDNAGWFYIATDNGGMQVSCISDIILDPAFWQALGKWVYREYREPPENWWKCVMEDMISALIAGKSLEEFFNEL